MEEKQAPDDVNEKEMVVIEESDNINEMELKEKRPTPITVPFFWSFNLRTMTWQVVLVISMSSINRKIP
ncbi:hypothetical protein Ddye_027801 [Dipteronia dyeriana]|uniref:Uncharacterized protein n=1 Tax=Dipteronia dyeriana TaxID=168575 RepID=A0AAD9WQV1_9ROSI|nr:hypothetical protein Ddye_027801 [Dipteronia dyeriana]